MEAKTIERIDDMVNSWSKVLKPAQQQTLKEEIIDLLEAIRLDSGAVEREWKRQPIFTYAGGLYIRPIGRGAILKDLDNWPGIEDMFDEGHYEAEIKVWRNLPAQGEGNDE